MAARLRRFGLNELAPPRRLPVQQELTRDLATPCRFYGDPRGT